MRFRVTIRGNGTEIRGYATEEATVLIAAALQKVDCMVIASPAEPSYDPFKKEEE